MTKAHRLSISLVFGILILVAGFATFALLALANAASAQDAYRVDLPEVAIPAAKCTGRDACTGIVDLSQVGDGSCIGDFACYHQSPYTGTIGAGSCYRYSACNSAAGPIGAGSCNDTMACYFAAGSIGVGSCNIQSACEFTAGSIGAGSCTGQLACSFAIGQVGTGSCTGTGACSDAAGPIGNSACNGDDACRDAAGSIGNSACNGTRACWSAAGPIGAGSCIGEWACVVATGPIGAGSCIGGRTYGGACYYAAGPIGTASCNGIQACDRAAGSIGNNSCNTTGMACRAGGNFPIGDCQYNDTLPVVCISPTTPDMRIDSIEVTQAVQDLNNSVVLVAEKRAYVRVHVSSPITVLNVSASLSGKRVGVSLYPILIPRNPDAQITVKSSPDRGQLDDSFWFELPSDWLEAGSLALTARLDPSNKKADPNQSNNTMSVTVSLHNTPPLRLKLIDVPYMVAGTTYSAASVHMDRLESWLRRAYPISDLQVTREAYTYSEPGLPNVDLLNTRLALARLFDITFGGEDSRTVYYGMVDDGGGFMRGKASGIPGTTAAGPTGTGTFGWDNDGSYGDWYGAHEIGHTRKRYHAEFCGAGGGATYPYEDGRISPVLTGSTALYGFDIVNRTIYGPDWHDVMTYCTNQWISDFTYEGIRDYLVEAGQAQLPSQSNDAAIYLAVLGMVDMESHTGRFEDVYLINQPATLPTIIAGDWIIALRNAAGLDLATYAIAPAELTHADEVIGRPAVIAAAVPAVPGLAQVQIRYQGQVIDARSTSATPPTVTITAPYAGQELGRGSYTFRWTASDLEGDPLSFSVLYSSDNGATWRTITTKLESPALEVDLNQLAGGSESRLRVIASDGFLSGEDVVGPFSVPTHSPKVGIISPQNHEQCWQMQLVVFEGGAFDPEDGQLSGTMLEWFSSLDGNLGTGEQLSIDTLSTGEHVISLRATDSDGLVSEVQQNLTVNSLESTSHKAFLPFLVR